MVAFSRDQLLASASSRQNFHRDWSKTQGSRERGLHCRCGRVASFYLEAEKCAVWQKGTSLKGIVSGTISRQTSCCSNATYWGDGRGYGNSSQANEGEAWVDVGIFVSRLLYMLVEIISLYHRPSVRLGCLQTVRKYVGTASLTRDDALKAVFGPTYRAALQSRNPTLTHCPVTSASCPSASMPVFTHQYADGVSRSLIVLGLGASAIVHPCTFSPASLIAAQGTTYHTYLLAALFSPSHPKKAKRLRSSYKTGALYMPLASALAAIGFFGAAIRMGQSDFVVRKKPTVFAAGALALFGMNP